MLIQGLFWPKLRTMERLSLASFLYHGHDYHLYAYGSVENVPPGVVVKDANEILPEQLVKTYGHIAQFADHFRYKLLYECGGCWADTDVVCLKPFDFKNEYVFATEDQKWLNNTVINAPKNAEVIKFMLDRCNAVTDGFSLPYTFLGPTLITEAVKNYGLQEFVRSQNVLCPVHWSKWRRDFLEQDTVLPSEALTVHLYRELWRLNKADMDASYPHSCLYERLKAKYLCTK